MSAGTSSAGGQAPESGQPQAGTPAQAATSAPGAQAQAPQAGASQSTQPKFVFNSQEEIEAFADRLIDQRRRANRQAQAAEGELSELKQQVQYLVTAQQLDRQRAIAANVQLEAKTLGFRNPAFVYGAILAQLQYDAAGQPTNVKTVLEALKASDSYLLETPPAPAVPGQPSVPGTPQQQPGQQAPISQTVLPAPSQPRTGPMNAPQSATMPPGGGLTWDVIQANIRNPAWVATNMEAIEAFQADPLNHQSRRS